MSDWRERAECLKHDAELFFPIGDSGPYLQQIRDAKEVCMRCPVRDTCLQEHLDEAHGIFGGLTDSERARVRREMGRRAKRRGGNGPRSSSRAAIADPTPGDDCGTIAGYSAHERRDETPCRECKDAKNARRRELESTRVASGQPARTRKERVS